MQINDKSPHDFAKSMLGKASSLAEINTLKQRELGYQDDLRKGHKEIEQLKAENERLKLALAGKTGSCILCEDAQKEIERLKLHDIPGYQEGIEELKARTRDLEEIIKGCPK